MIFELQVILILIIVDIIENYFFQANFSDATCSMSCVS